jgi:O-antigen ligase
MSRSLPTRVAANGSEGIRKSSATFDLLQFTSQEKRFLGLVMSCIATAILFPFPITKYAIGLVLLLYGLSALASSASLATALFLLFLPVFDLVPLTALGIPGFNFETAFLLIFVAMTARSAATDRIGFHASKLWLLVFLFVIALSIIVSWNRNNFELWDLIVRAKNWLFPTSLFFLAFKKFGATNDKRRLLFCVLLVGALLAMHGAVQALESGALLRNRPGGLLTRQPNLFGGFLSVNAAIGLFVGLHPSASQRTRWFCLGSSFVMIFTLMLTLSRGAWIAFALSVLAVGLLKNPRLIVVLSIALLVGYRWLPEDVATRTTETVDAFEQAPVSRGENIEDNLDDSTALRVIQWRTAPTIARRNVLLGTGFNSYPDQLELETGIRRSAHVMPVELLVESGVVALLVYLALFVSLFVGSLRAARKALSPFDRALGQGFAAATLCLLLLDFTGTRFRSSGVMVYYWTIAGLVMNVNAPLRQSRQPTR